MEAYRTEATLAEDGALTLTGMPFQAGERVQVIVLPVSTPNGDRDNRYPLRGMVYRYDDPFEPATGPDDWEANR
jgi:hypothetical protein